jgi:hypothetical protein
VVSHISPKGARYGAPTVFWQREIPSKFLHRFTGVPRTKKVKATRISC